MPRSSSISSIPSTSQTGHPTSGSLPRSQPPSPPGAPGSAQIKNKPNLAKASSLADLRLAKQKLFARFRGHGGAAADDDELWGTTEEDGEHVPSTDGYSDMPTAPLSAAPPAAVTRSPTPRAPRRPTAPYAFPLDAALNADELRRLERECEAELAAAAAIDYTLHCAHARRSSRSGSAAQIDTSSISPQNVAHAIERLNLGFPARPPMHAHKRSLSREVLEPAFTFEGRARSDSIASRIHSPTPSDRSSRPRTNDSLPSFTESASTVDTIGSFPPSPVQSPTLRGRPTFISSYKEVKVDTDAIAAQPRAYAFI